MSRILRIGFQNKSPSKIIFMECNFYSQVVPDKIYHFHNVFFLLKIVIKKKGSTLEKKPSLISHLPYDSEPIKLVVVAEH